MVRYRLNGQPNNGMVALDTIVRAMENVGASQEVIENVVLTAERAITLREAADAVGLPVYRVRLWYARGLLKECGYRPGPAPGGRLILVDLDDVRRLAANPPKPGPRIICSN